MLYHKQLFRHRPDEGIFGDCYRTAVACILDMPPQLVPHEHRVMTGDEQMALIDAFLSPLNIVRIAVPFQIAELKQALAVANWMTKGLPYVFTGTSANGTHHCVVGRQDRIIHDPAQDDSGIVGPTDDGHFWIELLVQPLGDEG
ncbi:MAG: hypothetical protein KIS96_14345 [Bauldia sp.]|nr:hypothetical protein [Bauldia sp.]